MTGLLIAHSTTQVPHDCRLDFSLDLRSNSEAEAVIQGWVQEMWGYSIAAASLGIKHKLVFDFQVEPGALSKICMLNEGLRGVRRALP